MTIKVGVMSDTHQEFGEYTRGFGEGDVLVLAGDNNVAVHLASQHPKILERDMLGRAKRQLASALESFDHVVMIAGNHEHYAGFFDLTHRIMVDKLGSDRVHILDKEVWHHKGVDFYGATMWTDINNGNAVSINDAHFGMADYQEIWKYDPYQSPPERKLHPMDTIEEHMQACHGLIDAKHHARENSNQLVVVTHHAPSYGSVVPAYQKGRFAHLNPAYYSALDHFMEPLIPLWVHGHMHSSLDYEVNGTRVVCNPHGITGANSSALNKKFNPTLTIEV